MKKLKIMVSLLLVILLTVSTAFAQTSKKADTDTEPAVIVEVKATPVPIADGQAFTVPGNADVLDNVADNSKEFYIITTENNNTFYLVIDKASTSRNVYMLSKVDENDLAEFIEDSDRTPVQPTPTPGASIIIQQPTIVPPVVDLPSDPAPAADTKADTTKLVLIIGVLIAGAIVYFKVYKPKKEAAESSSEHLENDDGEE